MLITNSYIWKGVIIFLIYNTQLPNKFPLNIKEINKTGFNFAGCLLRPPNI